MTESSFPSLEAANKLVNSTISRNSDKLQSVIDGQLPRAELDTVFSSPTGREAYSRNDRSQTVLSDTYGVRVVVVPGRTVSKGFRVDTAFPTNLNRRR
ncbi:MAG: RNase A-like domain-containing protein [Xanthobacteraceae bacterium]